MPSKEEIYDFLKKNKEVKFRAVHLAKLFKMDRFKMGDKLSSIYKNKVVFKGFDRKQIIAKSVNQRDFLCYVYFVK